MDVKPIHTEADYEAALGEIQRLWDAQPGTSDGDKFEVLAIEQEEVVYAVSVLVGNQIVTVIATADEVAELRIGDRVLLLAKAFNPMLLKIK